MHLLQSLGEGTVAKISLELTLSFLGLLLRL